MIKDMVVSRDPAQAKQTAALHRQYSLKAAFTVASASFTYRSILEVELFFSFKILSLLCQTLICLRKIAAILLLSIHLFNICGYRLFFNMLDNAANKRMVASIDNNLYNEADLFQIKFALHSPYIQGSGHYERCDGNIEYNGIQYNYVKRMVQSDTLYLYCIPNNKKTEISISKNEFANQNTTGPSESKQGRDLLKQTNFSSEFQLGFLDITLNGIQNLQNNFSSKPNIQPNSGFVTTQLQPPDSFI